MIIVTSSKGVVMAAEVSRLEFLCSTGPSYVLVIEPPLSQGESEAIAADGLAGLSDTVDIAASVPGTVLRIDSGKEGNKTLPEVAERIASVLASTRPSIEVDLEGDKAELLHELREAHPHFLSNQYGFRTRPSFSQLGKPIPGARLSREAQADLDRALADIDNAQRNALITGSSYYIGVGYIK